INLHLNKDALFMAKVIDWPDDSPQPIASLTESLGQAGEIESESRRILLEQEVDDTDFPDEVEVYVHDNCSDWSIPQDEKDRRRDFTNQLVFTIDPLTARDLDDALSIRRLK